MCLFWIGVSWLSLQPGVANFVSATIAAMTVFFVSRLFVFPGNASEKKAIFVYFAYTEANIIGWAALIQLFSKMISSVFSVPLELAAIIAKIVVTPFSLVCNFLVTRWLSLGKSK